ncbi:MAG TPA: response regulator transcription factor [Pyrinomonadaceae bacterium]|nr:response regulator transcription factor [Pyrinomonadaceae bacterium]
MADRKRILVVDDEPRITLVLRSGLSKHGYDIRVAAEGESALELFNAWSPDVVITDLSMPNMSGLELCRRLRETSKVPIIVLSVKEDENVKIEALDAGADDYVTKPFGIGELLARVRAVLRRSPADGSAEQTVIEDGDFRVDLEKRRVSVLGKEIHLSPKEFELLLFLFQHAGKVLTHRTLLGKIWGGNFTDQDEYLRVFISNLRKKIEPDPARPRYILTDPWVGYRFAAGEDSAKSDA